MLLNRIATEHDLSHSTLIHVKSFLSGVFTFAKRMGNLDANPMEGVEVPRGRQTKPTQAYSKEEIAKMIEVLTGVSRTAVILAAYTGMSLAELKGLKWQDVAENELTINQTVWRRTESPPKTQARHGSIPLLPIVKGVLAEHRKLNPSTVWVFESMYVRPMDLAGLGSNHIKKTLKGAGVNWLGWHALRRGFATRLHEEGVQDRIIQSLLRHSSLSVTMKHYVKATPKANIEAMQKLE